MRLNTIFVETQNHYLYEGLTLTEQKSLRLWEHAGVESTVIDKAFQDIGIQSSTTPSDIAPKTNNQTINTQEIVARIQKLTPAQQKEILALLGK